MTSLEIKNFYYVGVGANKQGHSESVSFKDADVLSLGVFKTKVTWIQLVKDHDHLVVHIKGKKGDLAPFARMRESSTIITEALKYERDTPDYVAPEVVQNA